MARRRSKKTSARSTRGWRSVAPHLRSEKEALYERCGAKAFLAPNKRDPGKSKFPVMAKHGPCEVDCRGLRAAKSRAAQYHHGKAKAKANRLGKSAACHWSA